MVKIPKNVSERLTKEINKFQKVLKTAKDRDVNESDTVTIITDMLASVFGFDKYTEITSEQAIRGTFCDLAIKLDGKIKFLIEVKAIGLNLKENHLRQAIGYGVTQGIQWVVLTNGVDWEIYKIIFEKPVDYDLVCSFGFTELNSRKQDDQNKIFLLCKEGIAKAAMEEFHDHVQSVNRFMLGAIILSDSVVSTIRRELRKISDGVKVTEEEIEVILSSEVLKRDVVHGESAEEAMKRVKKALKKQMRKKVTKNETGDTSQNEVESEQ
jgi:predicted type IV restriction endonuclease